MAKYPIGIQTFEVIREGGYMYIDKTQYVYDLANNYKYVFLTRPRRFGKSLLTSTFNSYLSNRKDLFEGLAGYDLEKDWVAYQVQQFSLSTAKMGTPSFLLNQIRKFNADISKYDNFTCIADEFDTPTEYMFSIIPLLYQCGYLTIKACEKRSRRYTLGFPNEEVKVGITQMLIPNYVSPNNNATITD